MRLGMPGLALLTIGAAMTLTAAPPAAQELCAGGRDTVVAAGSSPDLTEHQFERTDADPDALPVDELDATLPDADQLRAQFAQIDEDGDGRISREEWMRWFGPTYAVRATAVNSSPLGTD